jgi:hypothetical protein
MKANSVRPWLGDYRLAPKPAAMSAAEGLAGTARHEQYRVPLSIVDVDAVRVPMVP